MEAKQFANDLLKEVELHGEYLQFAVIVDEEPYLPTKIIRAKPGADLLSERESVLAVKLDVGVRDKHQLGIENEFAERVFVFFCSPNFQRILQNYMSREDTKFMKGWPVWKILGQMMREPEFRDWMQTDERELLKGV